MLRISDSETMERLKSPSGDVMQILLRGHSHLARMKGQFSKCCQKAFVSPYGSIENSGESFHRFPFLLVQRHGRHGRGYGLFPLLLPFLMPEGMSWAICFRGAVSEFSFHTALHRKLKGILESQMPNRAASSPGSIGPFDSSLTVVYRIRRCWDIRSPALSKGDTPCVDGWLIQVRQSISMNS